MTRKEQEMELYSIRQNLVYTKENAMKKKVGSFFLLADTKGNFLVTRVR